MAIEETRRRGDRIDVQERLARLRGRRRRSGGYRCGSWRGRGRRTCRWWCGGYRRRRNGGGRLLRCQRHCERFLGQAVVEPNDFLEVGEARLARLERPRLRRVDIDRNGQARELAAIGSADKIDAS